ncbi:D-alanyl-D-alanine carboxypeptidase family protein [Paenibacillus sp. ATY16]|uniref:D-alanyl-D-alanine carboxypeptidase family protein n=1 Tax=Paenibacillus sp. ATY16 TaxID=1759312 RepID=UPI00200F791C|nr:D-alanyl-D-alanine carboxypeptidase family protein [Paenibacillus sp. ATY16]MCK9857928.1 D-alanyl-D-alanine carboxypeptidase family protein [Paenibacillus sp. ATY16]
MRRNVQRRKRRGLAFLAVCVVAIAVILFIRYENLTAEAPEETAANSQTSEQPSPTASDEPAGSSSDEPTDTPSDEPSDAPSDTPSETDKPANTPADKPAIATAGEEDGYAVVAQPASIAVLVDKQYKLPDNYEPKDLVYPDVRFTFSEKIEKRKMRKEAAGALEELFAGAEKDGIHLAGVSAYRSQETQKKLFNNYVARDGLEKAKTYSAFPGTSEHQTGLAIDVSGSDGKCAATDCFGGTPEAEWLADHAPEYGFIIRYPEGKDAITGYKYEPWHLRYVGKELAKEIDDKGLTLEEYYNAVPVSK